MGDLKVEWGKNRFKHRFIPNRFESEGVIISLNLDKTSLSHELLSGLVLINTLALFIFKEIMYFF